MSNGNSPKHNGKPHRNQNRPPVRPDNPDRPNPFDPFSANRIADGGQTITSDSELYYQEELSPTNAQTPEYPSGPKLEPSPKNTIEASSDTLMGLIDEFVNSCEIQWGYDISITDSPSELLHEVEKVEEIAYKINRVGDEYLAINEYQGKNGATSYTYDTFENAIAAIIEAIDWGSLPTNNPEIWSYEGFSNDEITMIDYLGKPNNGESCTHTFTNHSAEYQIQIKSIPSPKPDNTETFLTFYLIENERTPIYQTRMSGQKQAFDLIISLLHEGLSKQLYDYNLPIGPSDEITQIASK